MCKYCESKNNFADVGIRLDTDKHRVYLCGGNNKPPDDERFDFCPKCGTPLGEVKPLTVECLKTINKDIENRRWVWVQVLQTFPFEDKVSAYYRVHMDYTDGEMFCCGYPGLSFGFKYSDYATTWLVYDREPKGEIKCQD